MPGIAGWVDFERNLSREAARVRAMTATMACRGPDGEGVWVGRSAGFGHRRLAAFDLEDGRQPVTAEHDGTLIAVGMPSGPILNPADPRRHLSARGPRVRAGAGT